MKPLHTVFVAALLSAANLAAHAQILIGQTVGLTGAVAATVKESSTGAMLYIDAINAKGGVRGEKIEIVTLDDKFDPKLTLLNAKTLIEQRQVVALFMTRGTPHTAHRRHHPCAGSVWRAADWPVHWFQSISHPGKTACV